MPPPRRPPVDSGSVQGVYFAGFVIAAHARPLLVLAGWLLIALGGLYLLSRKRRPTPEAV